MSDPVPATRSRLDWLDWLRGVAVLVMIEAHTVDAWTQVADRSTLAFGRAFIVGGMGAPLFLFLAGVAVALAAESRVRRSGDARAAARSVRRRGWEIFGLAFLFRLQSYLLNPGASVDGLLKVDILNVMGPSIVLSAVAVAARRNAPGKDWRIGRSHCGDCDGDPARAHVVGRGGTARRRGGLHPAASRAVELRVLSLGADSSPQAPWPV